MVGEVFREGVDDYYLERQRASLKVAEGIGSALATVLMVAGVHISGRYKEFYLGRVRADRVDGIEPDCWDKIVLATLPNKDKHRALIAKG